MKRSIIVGLLLGLVAVSLMGTAWGDEASPRFVSGRGTRTPSFVTGLRDAAPLGSPAVSAVRYLAGHPEFHIPSPRRVLGLVQVSRAFGLTTVRLAQRYRGVPVFGAQYLVHLRGRGPDRVVTGANGHYFTRLHTSTTPRISMHGAGLVAVTSLQPISRVRIVAHGLTVLPFGSGILSFHDTVWGSRFRHLVKQQVFVDARTGAVALSYDDLESAASPVKVSTRNAHKHPVTIDALDTGHGTTQMRDVSRPMYDPSTGTGQIETYDAGGGTQNIAFDQDIVSWPTGSTVRPAYRQDGAVDAHWGAERVYEFYAALGRNSIDGKGMSIVSIANLAAPGGSPLYNAFWDGTKMNYGNPDPSQLYPFSADLDVVAHELTHGVTQHSAALVYQGQSGAMNEAYSDYFGNAVDMNNTPTMSMDNPKSGYIGEDLCRVKFPEQWHCPLRNMSNPHTTGDPSTTSEYLGVLPDFDNGAVHTNMNIYSSALWEIRKALFDIEGGQPGADRSDRIVYAALTQFDTPLDTFVDGRNAVLAAAQSLGGTQAELDAINKAFDDHGIVQGWESARGTDATTLVANDFPLSAFGITQPKASGRRFVYSDVVDKAKSCCRGQELFAWNVGGTGSPVPLGGPVAKGPGDVQPDLSGNRAVWSRLELVPGKGLRGAIQTSTIGGPVQTIPSTGLALHPAISGKRIVWDTAAGFRSDIHTYVLGGSVRQLTTTGAAQLPATNGRWVAWWDVSGGSGPRIVLEDMRTGRTTVAASSGARRYVGPPSLNDGSLFWYSESNNSGVGSIERMRLATGTVTTLVGPDMRGSGSPRWSGATDVPVVSVNAHYATYVDEATLGAWAGGRILPLGKVGRNVYIVSLAGGKPSLVTRNAGDQAYPSMAGSASQVLWLDGSQGQVDIVTRATPTGSG